MQCGLRPVAKFRTAPERHDVFNRGRCEKKSKRIDRRKKKGGEGGQREGERGREEGRGIYFGKGIFFSRTGQGRQINGIDMMRSRPSRGWWLSIYSFPFALRRHLLAGIESFLLFSPPWFPYHRHGTRNNATMTTTCTRTRTFLHLFGLDTTTLKNK